MIVIVQLVSILSDSRKLEYKKVKYREKKSNINWTSAMLLYEIVTAENCRCWSTNQTILFCYKSYSSFNSFIKIFLSVYDYSTRKESEQVKWMYHSIIITCMQVWNFRKENKKWISWIEKFCLPVPSFTSNYVFFFVVVR